MKTILHFNLEREHLDSEEATVFPPPFFSRLQIKLLLLKQTKDSMCLYNNDGVFLFITTLSSSSAFTMLKHTQRTV